MPDTIIPTETLKVSQARPQLSELLNRVYRRETRVLITKGTIPVAAIVPVADLERLNRLDEEREAAFQVFDEIGAAYADQSPERIGQEVARAIVQDRAEQSQRREVAASQ